MLTIDNNSFSPVLYRTTISEDFNNLNILKATIPHLIIRDEIHSQLRELIKIQNPSLKLSETEYEQRIKAHLQGLSLEHYGVWVYYPWNNNLVHLLDKDEFILVRTNRNRYKITEREHQDLQQKKVGIIGLSVGQSIALTMAMERVCGELRLADFDTTELSNLNRIRTGVHNLGLKKTVIAAREIAEIDPFLTIKIFNEGLQKENFDDFFCWDGKLDLLIEVCDGLDIKIESRYKARELNIPVIMETNDRGMLDVERFDIEPGRPILHGLAQGLDPENIKGLSNEDKIPYILKIVDAHKISTRLKASMLEVEQSINTWPQLASSVVLGGAVTTDVARRVLLNTFTDSGRYYIDLEQLIHNRTADQPLRKIRINPYQPLSVEQMRAIIGKVNASALLIDDNIVKKLVTAACAAPSTGNDQPWKWLYTKGIIYLFHDRYRSYSFGDFKHIASYLSFGAAFENLYLEAQKYGLEASAELFPNEKQQELIAKIHLKNADTPVPQQLSQLSQYIGERLTNRNQSGRPILQASIYADLSTCAESIPGAKTQWFTTTEEMDKWTTIIGACDKIRLLNEEGHDDFVHHEMRWTPEEAEFKKDGIDIQTLGLSNSQMAALDILKDQKAIEEINRLKAGKGLEMIAKKAIESAAALCLITLPKYSPENFFHGGRALERFWLKATQLELAVHPLISPLYLFPRIVHGNGESLTSHNIEELVILREKFRQLTRLDDNHAEVFLVKVSRAESPKIKSFRLPLSDTLFII